MSAPEYKRWYDRDPVLRQALESLREATDKYQVQIALNIILIVVEHQIETRTLSSVEDLVGLLEDTKTQTQHYYRRWYDVNQTLRSAMELLRDCPEDIQDQVIPSISKMIEDSLAQVSST
jgi:hypothetical protein